MRCVCSVWLGLRFIAINNLESHIGGVQLIYKRYRSGILHIPYKLMSCSYQLNLATLLWGLQCYFLGYMFSSFPIFCYKCFENIQCMTSNAREYVMLTGEGDFVRVMFKMYFGYVEISYC